MQYESEDKISDKINKGWGQGRGDKYIPYLHASDISPIFSYRYRMKGIHNRTYHLGSKFEYYVFHQLMSNPHVIEIREQFPLLNRGVTLSICEALKINHPGYNKQGKVAQIMTTDFLVTVDNGSYKKELAIEVKKCSTLADARELDLLEIKSVYFNHLGIDLKVVTEYQMDKEIVMSSEWVFSALNFQIDEWFLNNSDSCIELAKSKFMKYRLS